MPSLFLCLYGKPFLFLLPFHPINFWISVSIGANRDQVDDKNHDVDRAVEHSLSGSLLKLKIDVDSLAGVQCAKQRGELGWRGSVCKGGPAACKPITRGSATRAPRAVGSYCTAAPWRCWFFSPPRVVPRTDSHGFGRHQQKVNAQHTSVQWRWIARSLRTMKLAQPSSSFICL